MSDRFKKIFLAASIILPFILYCVYYYSVMIKNAPYKFTELKSITLKTGNGEQYDKSYSTQTKVFQYLNSRDSLVKSTLTLSKDDMLYLHRKAAELGLWDMPAKMLSDSTKKAPRYFVEFTYERKSKSIEIDAAFNGDPKLKDSAIELIKTVDKTVEAADDAQH